MRISRQIKLTDYGRLKGKVPDVLLGFLKDLYIDLQAYNRQVQETISGNTQSGTEVIDNGTTRITKVYKEGRLTSVTTAASAGATISWTDA